MKTRSVGYYFHAAAAIAGILALILYFVYTANLGQTDAIVIICLLAGAGCFAASLFIGFEPLVLIGTAAYAVGTFRFLTSQDVVGSYADYFSNIVAFGHPELVGIITFSGAVMLLAAVAAVIGCFMADRSAT